MIRNGVLLASVIAVSVFGAGMAGCSDAGASAAVEIMRYLEKAGATPSAVEVVGCEWQDPTERGLSSYGIFACELRSSRMIVVGDHGAIRVGSDVYCFDVPRANTVDTFDMDPVLLGRLPRGAGLGRCLSRVIVSERKARADG